LVETLLQKVIQRKLRLFGHICRMDDSRKIKTLVFGMMDGSNKRGRPHREWSDDIEQWCGATLQQLKKGEKIKIKKKTEKCRILKMADYIAKLKTAKSKSFTCTFYTNV